MQRTPGAERRSPVPSSPRPLVAAAVLVAVAVGGGTTVVVLLGRGDVPPPASASPEPQHAPTLAARPLPWGGVDWLPPVVDPFGRSDPLLRIDGVTEAGDSLVAWGRLPQPGRNQFNDMGAVFHTDDGKHWTSVPVEHGVNAESTSTIIGVTAGEDALVAYGSVCCAGESPAVWFSEDGLGWERQPLDAGEPGNVAGYLVDVVSFADGWVMLGAAPDGSTSRIWQSGDGRRWRLVFEVEGGRHHAAISDLAVVDEEIVAVGTVVGPDATYDGGVWRSADGVAWERIAGDDHSIAGPAEVQLRSVIAYPGGLVATGLSGTPEQRRTCEQLLGMTAALGSPLPAAAPGVALSCSIGSERQWTSDDGVSWHALEEPPVGPRPTDLRVSAVLGRGLVALAESTAPGSPDTTLFATLDGRGWRLVDPAPPMLAESPVGIAVRGDLVIAVTQAWVDDATSWRVWIGRAR